MAGSRHFFHGFTGYCIYAPDQKKCIALLFGSIKLSNEALNFFEPVK